MTSSNDDCYFYYYSSCAKGVACPFRHEPAALAQEVMCLYWKQGSCTRPNCIYRHLDVTAKNRKVKQCYWETQPGGCRKPHCPFLHDKPKEPYSQEIIDILEQKSKDPSAPTNIIVNKNKIGELGNLILPVKVADGEKPRKVIDTLKVKERLMGKLSVKDRLGPVGKRVSVRDRLGGVVDDDLEEANLELYECSNDSDGDDEAEKLRLSAINTLDLRSRIGTITPEKEIEDDDEEMESKKTLKSVVKKVKKEKKEKKKKKKEKKEKKSKSKKDESDEEQTKRIVKRVEGADSDENDGDDSKMSLADKIAARRDTELASNSVHRRLGSKLEDNKSSRKRAVDKSSDEDEDRKERRKKRKSDESKEVKSIKQEKDEEYAPIGDRKLRLRKMSEAKAEMSEVEKFLRENSASDANSTVDVMKELDELLKD